MTESSFRQLLLRFAYIPLLCLCGFLAVLGLQLREIALLRLAGAQATTVLLQSNRLQKCMIDEETSIRGYLVTKDSEFLAPYREASGQIDGELSKLKDLTAFDLELAARAARISASYKHFDDVNQASLKGGFSNDALIDALKQQKQAMDALRSEFTDFESREYGVRESKRQQVTKIFSRLPAIGIGGGVLIAVLVVLHGRILYRDITLAYHQQLNETGLQRDSLQTTLQSIGDAVMVCDDSGIVTMLNPTAEELTGWSRDEAIGRSLSEIFQIIHEGNRLPIESPVDKVRRLNTAVTLENHTLLVRKDGAEIPIDDSGAPIRDRDGNLSGVVLVFRSVAERRHAANLIRQNQERFNSIYNTTLEYIGILSPDGILLDCNRASLEFAGNSRADVVGHYFWDCPWFIHTSGMPDRIRTAVERAATGQSTRIELALNRPSGETVDFDFSLTPVFGSGGEVIYLVPESRDISELKRAERALIQSEKLAAVGRLATSIAHEINNPLEAVTNLLYLAQDHAILPEVSEYLKSADQELRRVSAIANQTLRFHRQSSNPQPVQAADLFSTVLSIYEGRLRNSNISVEVSHRAHEPIVCFDGDVRQVLNNLVGNAIDSMSNREGRLIIRSQVATDWPTSRRGIVFTVADTGNGIARKDLQRIFEPFFTTKGIGGTGLGLWVSREVVSRHNGTLKVRSSDVSKRAGTVFRFFLPFA